MLFDLEQDVRLDGTNTGIEKMAIQVGGANSDEASPCFPISEVELVGEEAAKFRSALNHALRQTHFVPGKCLHAGDINQIMSLAQNALIGRGYTTTRILAAPQDLNSGKLQLTLMPKSRSYISNLLRLLDLEDYIKNELISGNLTSAQGRTLLSIKESDKRKKYFEKLLNKEINIRDLEETAKGRRFKNRSEKTGLDVFQSEIVEKLEEKLGTKVRLNFKGKGGKIEVDFYNDEDLERILNLIEGE